jgi:hypothetical protein
MFKNKKNQITVFIIIGIIILFFIILSIIILNNINLKHNVITFSEESVSNYVKNCIEFEAIKAVKILGIQGGYINIPSDNLLYTNEDETSKTTLLYNQGNNNVPSKEQIEEQITEYVIDNMITCLNNFQVYRDIGIDVSFSEPTGETFITEKEIIIILDFPINLHRMDSTITINNFQKEIKPIRKLYIMNTVTEIVDFYSIEKGFDLTNLEDKDLDIIIVPYKEESIIVLLKDKKSEIYNSPYNFRFALTTN